MLKRKIYDDLVAWSEVKLFGGLLEFSLRLSCYMT